MLFCAPARGLGLSMSRIFCCISRGMDSHANAAASHGEAGMGSLGLTSLSTMLPSSRARGGISLSSGASMAVLVSSRCRSVISSSHIMGNESSGAAESVPALGCSGSPEWWTALPSVCAVASARLVPGRGPSSALNRAAPRPAPLLGLKMVLRKLILPESRGHKNLNNNY